MQSHTSCLDQSGGDRTGCIGTEVHYWYSIATIVLDVLVLAMPWREVLKLRMDWRKKVVVLAMFGLGAIVTAVSIGKCYTFFTVGDRLRKYHDLTYDNAPLFYWTVPECCLAVVCACLPTLRPIFRLISTTPLRGLLSLSTFRSGSGKHGDASKAYVLSTHEGKDRHSTAGFKRISTNSALIGRGCDVETDDLEGRSFVSPV
ncbi:hypothetical protein B0O99DRAFT_93755 [Bisporella sp. PMI_857]|nr:hypothetical protein B0O99DRAFT_93755 [Bisporella sp. PMI_857]